jgi:3-deoxy-D-manno-octulosonic-acid transferase
VIAATVYRLATQALGPVAPLILARRAANGKEDAERLGERWGRASLVRGPGPVVWLHAASVGESLSLLPVVERLMARLAQAQILVTTGTVTSARLLAGRLPAGRALHQFLPLDHPAAIARFLDHWRPDLAVWVESELWPNLVLETHRRGVPMALLNARLSARSLRGWQRAPGFIRSLLGCFSLVLAQDAAQAERLRRLGAADAETVGDLKAAMNVPDAPEAELARLKSGIANRPVWLAASTHDGEETQVAAAHQALRDRFPNLLTLLAPRHPGRADGIAAELAGGGFAVTRRSVAPVIDDAVEIHLVDTMGELGLFYRLAPIVLVAGSLGAPGSIGGHNPLEAAQLGCAVLFGPDTQNCAASAASLERAGAAIRLGDTGTLADTLRRLLADKAEVARMGQAAGDTASAGRAVVDRVLHKLEPLVAPLAVTKPCNASA